MPRFRKGPEPLPKIALETPPTTANNPYPRAIRVWVKVWARTNPPPKKADLLGFLRDFGGGCEPAGELSRRSAAQAMNPLRKPAKIIRCAGFRRSNHHARCQSLASPDKLRTATSNSMIACSAAASLMATIRSCRPPITRKAFSTSSECRTSTARCSPLGP